MGSSIFDELPHRREAEQAREDERAREAEEVSSDIPEPEPTREHYTLNECSFERPDGLTDQTYHVLTSGPIGQSPFNVTVSRGLIDHDKTLEHVLQSTVAQLEKLPGYESSSAPHMTSTAGLPSARHAYRWRYQGQLLHVDTVMLILPNELGQSVQIALNATSSNEHGMTGQQLADFAQILETFTPRCGVEPDMDSEEAVNPS